MNSIKVSLMKIVWSVKGETCQRNVIKVDVPRKPLTLVFRSFAVPLRGGYGLHHGQTSATRLSLSKPYRWKSF